MMSTSVLTKSPSTRRGVRSPLHTRPANHGPGRVVPRRAPWNWHWFGPPAVLQESRQAQGHTPGKRLREPAQDQPAPRCHPPRTARWAVGGPKPGGSTRPPFEREGSMTHRFAPSCWRTLARKRQRHELDGIGDPSLDQPRRSRRKVCSPQSSSGASQVRAVGRATTRRATRRPPRHARACPRTQRG